MFDSVRRSCNRVDENPFAGRFQMGAVFNEMPLLERGRILEIRFWDKKVINGRIERLRIGRGTSVASLLV